MNLKSHVDAGRVQSYFLDGKQVRKGDQIEAFVNDEWIQVMFELPADDLQARGVLPGGEVVVTLSKGLPIRWPERQE
jgi:hypothetical protein